MYYTICSNCTNTLLSLFTTHSESSGDHI